MPKTILLKDTYSVRLVLDSVGQYYTASPTVIKIRFKHYDHVTHLDYRDRAVRDRDLERLDTAMGSASQQ